MQCDRKAAHGGQEPSTQDRTNQKDDTQKNYLKKDLIPLLCTEVLIGVCKLYSYEISDFGTLIVT